MKDELPVNDETVQRSSMSSPAKVIVRMELALRPVGEGGVHLDLDPAFAAGSAVAAGSRNFSRVGRKTCDCIGRTGAKSLGRLGG
jgi:hypothetical protein